MMRKAQDGLKRIIVPMPSELLARIEEYRASRRPLPSRAQAIRELIEAGLQNPPRPRPRP